MVGGQALPQPPLTRLGDSLRLSDGKAVPQATNSRMARAAVVNINDVLEGHIRLELDCLDRIYLNAYVNKLQVEGPGRVLLARPPRQPGALPGVVREDRQPVPGGGSAFAKDNGDPRASPCGPRPHPVGTTASSTM